MSKSPQSTTPNTGRPMMALSANIAKSLSSSDEFKQGFPSKGLSTASNRWWGAESSSIASDDSPAAFLLTATRKKAAEEGRRRTAKLGVTNRKSGEKDRALLRRVFGSSLPIDWLEER